MLDLSTLNLVSGSLGLLSTLAWTLNERAEEFHKPLLNQMLGLMHSTVPVFERVALAFDNGEDVEEVNLDIVRTVLTVRISLEDALHRIDDEHLDWYVSVVDEALKPFEHALFMLDLRGDDLERYFDYKVFIDPDAWFGLLVRPELEEARCLVAVALDRIWERNKINEMVAASGVSREKAERCLDLAEQHLRNLWWKWSRADRNPQLMGQNCIPSDAQVVWDCNGHPLRHRIVEVATKLLKTSVEKLDRFEKHLRYSY
jgi:hypothetical protein